MLGLSTEAAESLWVRRAGPSFYGNLPTEDAKGRDFYVRNLDFCWLEHEQLGNLASHEEE